MILESLKDRPAKPSDAGKFIYNEKGKKYTLKSFSSLLNAFNTEFNTINLDSDDWYWQNPVEALK